MITFLLIVEDEVTRSKLEEIYYLYHKDMFYIAHDILKDYHEAEDVVQSAILKISKHLDKIIDIKCNNTRGFIVVIARNIALNIYKQRMSRTSVPIEELENILVDESTLSSEQNILRIDQGKWIAEQLALIKPVYADILTLKFTYEYSIGEIATLLNLSEGNVRVRLTRAKKALHSILGGVELERSNQ